jgi:hypothetical protein
MTEQPGLFDLPDPPRPHSPDLPDDTFPELWNRAADPFAPLTDLPGATWEPISVEVVRAR